ncbi:7tm 6 domain containing protein [Asbolus verrucosus]|uniref:Odorant receptor n=1 Tax=Asbolus verrucosus TaxID=1661398 RepID=A0A482VSE3_ASBVE|nr:7tm 6 domain containing protein [Asbolus verrucosus]
MEKFDWVSTISRNIRGLRVIGLWPESEEGYKMDLYTLYTAVCINSLMVIHVMCQVINIIASHFDMDLIVEIFHILLQKILGLIKMYVFMRNIKTLKQLLKNLNGDVFQPKNMEQRLLVKPTLRGWKLVFNVFFYPTMTTVLLCGLIPILNGSYKNYRLPFLAWYPFNTKRSPMYQIVFAHQMISFTFLAITVVSIDMLTAALLMYVGIQCDILCNNLRNLGYDNRDGIDFEKSLIACIEHHQNILDFSEKCNSLISFTVLVQFFISALTAALALYQIAYFEIYSLQFCNGLMILGVSLIQTTTYCWFGNEVEVKASSSGLICYAAFQSNWTEQSPSAKKILMIFMIRSLTPIKISSYNLFYLSLETHKKILQSTWSYFTMLRQFGGVN